MKMVISDPPLMPFWAWSTLLHVGVVIFFSVIHVNSTIEDIAPVVQVTLVDATSPEPSPEPSHQGRTIVDPKTPAPLQAQRVALTTPQPVFPVQQSLKTLHLQPPVTLVANPVKTPDRVRSLQRNVLRDSYATNNLQIKNYFKVAQRSPVSRKTTRPVRRQLEMISSSVNLPTPLTTRPSPSSTSRATPAIHRPASPHILKARVPGSGNISKSKVGFGRTIPPVYPRIARESGWEGIALIRVTVKVDGSPDSISVRKSSGHTVLDHAAVDAVKKWKFLPAKDGNIPIRSIVEIPINFDLRQQG